MEMEKRDELYRSNTTTLAYVGDAVYEVFIRKRLLTDPNINTKKLHKEAIRYVSAAGQCLAIRTMFDDLTEEEQGLVKRARNRQSATKPKNADPVEYKWATAFEALVGFLDLAGEKDRAEEIMERAVAVCDEEYKGGTL